MHIANPNRSATSSSTRLALQAISETLVGKALIILSASLFVALCAHVSIRVPFTPVPFTLSDLAVVLVGLALGPAAAFSAMILYLMEGTSGLPVFNPGGLGGIAQLLGPTGGFLFAYPFAALLASAAQIQIKKLLPPFPSALTAAVLASTLIILAGVTRLAFFPGITLASAFHLGALPFLPGQIVKVFAAAGIVTSLRRWRRA